MTDSTTPSFKNIYHAVKTRRPVLLELGFDPGWNIMRGDFEQKPAALHTPRYVSEFMKSAHHTFPVHSAEHFMELTRDFKKSERNGFAQFDRIKIGYEGDIRPFWNVFIGQNPTSLAQLKTSFHTGQPFVSKLDPADRRAFVEDFETREKRASTFPRAFIFKPSQQTRAGEKGDSGLLIGSAIREGFNETARNKNQGELVGILAIDAKDPDIRVRLISQRQSLVIATPYVRPERLQHSFEEAMEYEAATTQYTLIQMKVTDPAQITGRVPHFMLRRD